MLIDTHCHLTNSYFDGKDSLNYILNRAYDANVMGFIAVGTNIPDCNSTLALAEKNSRIQASLGVHPHEANNWNQSYENDLNLMLNNPNVRFVGETGLDLHYNLSSKHNQTEVFRKHIRLARKHKKPIIVHTRKAPQETIDILIEEDAYKVGGIIHCFSEDINFARKVLDLNFYLSFSGILTFKNADTIRTVASWMPKDRILIETDSPYLSPHPHRGKTNEPALLIHTANCLAQLRKISLEQLENNIVKNLENLCGWPN